jgi:hypothetical protein
MDTPHNVCTEHSGVLKRRVSHVLLHRCNDLQRSEIVQLLPTTVCFCFCFVLFVCLGERREASLQRAKNPTKGACTERHEIDRDDSSNIVLKTYQQLRWREQKQQVAIVATKKRVTQMHRRMLLLLLSQTCRRVAVLLPLLLLLRLLAAAATALNAKLVRFRMRKRRRG